MLQIEHLTKTYGDKKAVDDLSLHILPGEIYGFIGHNGAGKDHDAEIRRRASCSLTTGRSASTAQSIQHGAAGLQARARLHPGQSRSL